MEKWKAELLKKCEEAIKSMPEWKKTPISEAKLFNLLADLVINEKLEKAGAKKSKIIDKMIKKAKVQKISL